MRIRTLTLATLAAAAMGLTVLSTATTASAAPVQKPRNCVMNVANGTTACYGSFTAAVSAATGGKITDAPNDASTAANDPRMTARLNATAAEKTKTTTPGARTAAGSIVIGIEYEDSDFEDSSLIYSATAGCTATISDLDWVAASMPSGWNDEIGSYRAYANCWARHFGNINFGGAAIGFDSARSSLGSMDDETSSIQWS